MEQLDGLRALVTGGGSGIGAAIAARLKLAGASVLIVDRDPGTSPDVVADVADTAAVDGVFAEVAGRLGGLDVLVNNVGVAGPTAAVDEMDPDAFDECVRINLGSMFRCTRLAVPLPAGEAGFDHQHLVHRGNLRLPAAFALRGRQMGGDRLDQDVGDGTRIRRHSGQRHLSRLCRRGEDGRSDRA